MADNKLSKLAIKTEVTLRKVLDAIAKDIDAAVEAEKKGVDRQARYSLTDFMKVADRALKLESIRLSVQTDDEGSFFKNSIQQEDEGAENEGTDDT